VRKLTAELEAARSELVRERARVRELEADIERLKRQPPARAKAAKVVHHDAAARVRELEAELARQKEECNDARGRYWKIREYLELRTEGIFTRAEFNKVRAVLHPDRAQGEAEKKNATRRHSTFSVGVKSCSRKNRFPRLWNCRARAKGGWKRGYRS
jgi:hypothetical protein